jgi:hypothetical protein
MRRNTILLAVLLTFGVVGTAPPAHAGSVLPYRSRPYGHSSVEWTRTVAQFFLGDASNPLFAALLDGDCGEVRDGVFLMAAPIDVGLEFDCEVRPGMPIVLSHAGFFSFAEDGMTDQDIEDQAIAGFVTSVNELSLDGVALPLQPIDSGAFDVISQPGSFYDTIAGAGTGPVRTFLRANVVVLHPLPPGDHVIEGHVSFVGDGEFSATWHVHVG